jgi:hypothetical protein
MSPRPSSALFLVIPIDRAATSYHLLDFNLAALPTVLFFLRAGNLDFVSPTEKLAFVVFMAGSLPEYTHFKSTFWSCVPDVMRSTDFAFQ